MKLLLTHGPISDSACHFSGGSESARGTAPSVDSLTCLPVTAFARSRFPGIEFFAMDEPLMR